MHKRYFLALWSLHLRDKKKIIDPGAPLSMKSKLDYVSTLLHRGAVFSRDIKRAHLDLAQAYRLKIALIQSLQQFAREPGIYLNVNLIHHKRCAIKKKKWTPKQSIPSRWIWVSYETAAVSQLWQTRIIDVWKHQVTTRDAVVKASEARYNSFQQLE